MIERVSVLHLQLHPLLFIEPCEHAGLSHVSNLLWSETGGTTSRESAGDASSAECEWAGHCYKQEQS